MDNIDLLHQTLLEGLAQVTGINHCSDYPRRRDQIKLPALLLDLVEIEPGKDPGTGELSVITHWEARLVTTDSQNESVTWNLTITVLLWLYNQSFPDKNIGMANIKQASPDNFSPDLQGHRVWLIEWTHKVRFGDNIWNGEGVIPGELWVSCNDEPYVQVA